MLLRVHLFVVFFNNRKQKHFGIGSLLILLVKGICVMFSLGFFLLGGPQEDSSLPKADLIVLARQSLLVFLNHCSLLHEPSFLRWYPLFLSRSNWVVVITMVAMSRPLCVASLLTKNFDVESFLPCLDDSNVTERAMFQRFWPSLDDSKIFVLFFWTFDPLLCRLGSP